MFCFFFYICCYPGKAWYILAREESGYGDFPLSQVPILCKSFTGLSLQPLDLGYSKHEFIHLQLSYRVKKLVLYRSKLQRDSNSQILEML